MVIDLRRLAGGVSYDDDRWLATVSAAADLHSVQTALAAHGRSIPSGTCPTVGVAGLTLGGGLGPDTRRSGLARDALVSASAVLPSGESVTVTPGDHANLLWALRGYVNYVEPDTPAARYFGGNLARLNAIRQRYDPDGRMYSGMSY